MMLLRRVKLSVVPATTEVRTPVAPSVASKKSWISSRSSRALVAHFTRIAADPEIVGEWNLTSSSPSTRV